MNYLILCLLLLGSTASADPLVMPNERPKGANDPASAVTAQDGSHHNLYPVQGNVLPNVSYIAAAPSEFLSAPQYQPQPLPQNGPSPLYSMNPH